MEGMVSELGRKNREEWGLEAGRGIKATKPCSGLKWACGWELGVGLRVLSGNKRQRACHRKGQSYSGTREEVPGMADGIWKGDRAGQGTS